MKKNRLQSISPVELDHLLNRVFLETDFDQPLNRQALESISRRALVKNFRFPLSGKGLTGKLIFLTGIVVSLLLAVMVYFSHPKPSMQQNMIKREAVHQAYFAEPKNNLPVSDPVKRKVKKFRRDSTCASSNQPVNMFPETGTFSGHVFNVRTGGRLAGAVVYLLNSNMSTTARPDGSFSLTLPKGENNIAVTMIGYLTRTFMINVESNTTMDIGLSETTRALDEVVVRPPEYVFPNLNEKQRKSNEREKIKMAKLAARVKLERAKRDEKYPYIPAPAGGAFGGFNMSSFEISNLEYRTFLFDLLINGKKEEFLAAKPEQHLWRHADGQDKFDTLAVIYFSERGYNSFPVVNIPPVGAQMYCEWLTEQANMVRRKEGKNDIKVRLPTEKEWLHAASGGRSGAAYPWPSDSIQNHVNWFLANVCIQKLSDQLKHPLGHLRKFSPNAYTSAGFVLAKDKTATVEVFAYNPNDFYLYCMSGNASEMVFVDGTNALKTKGGNWASDFEHAKLYSEDEFKSVKPSPMIGFRVCIDSKR